jgi:hypothetical protein
MVDHDLSVRREENIQLDAVHAECKRLPECSQRILGRKPCGAPVSDDQHSLTRTRTYLQ